MAFEDYDRDKLFAAIYEGLITVANLPKGLFQRTFDHLFNGFKSGVSINYEMIDKTLIRELTENVYLFSGAKTKVQISEMIGSMVKDGNIIPFNEFKKIANEKFEQYNVNWLQAEYNTAIGQGQIVSEWSEFYRTKERFPYLRYEAVIDSRTSQICLPLDNVTLPVNDPFWNKYSPLNHFNCRCRLIKLSEYDEPELTSQKEISKKTKVLDKTVSDVFKMNPYYDKVVFSKKHPYFSEAKKIDKK